jgi:hypothetical protein
MATFRFTLAILTVAALTSVVCDRKPPRFGSVSGFVFCSDTNTPARLGSVALRPLASAKANNSGSAATDGVCQRWLWKRILEHP